MNCINCKKETLNPKFCCRSCSVSFNNRKSPKRRLKQYYCSSCGGRIHRTTYKSKRKLCKDCSTHLKRKDIEQMTIQKMQERQSTKGKHPSWLNANIRNLNRSWNKELLLLPCANCGYSKHVELCHIKPISSFPLSATIKEINEKSNIIQLCPTCHWELDNHILKL